MRVPRDSEQMSQGSVKYRSSGASQLLMNNNHNAMQHNQGGSISKGKSKGEAYDQPSLTDTARSISNSARELNGQSMLHLPAFSAATLRKRSTIQHCTWTFHHNSPEQHCCY